MEIEKYTTLKKNKQRLVSSEFLIAHLSMPLAGRNPEAQFISLKEDCPGMARFPIFCVFFAK